MQALNTTKLVILIIGGLNWGLVGFFKYNLVDGLFGAGSVLARVIYAIVGLVAVWALIDLFTKPAEKNA